MINLEPIIKEETGEILGYKEKLIHIISMKSWKEIYDEIIKNLEDDWRNHIDESIVINAGNNTELSKYIKSDSEIVDNVREFKNHEVELLVGQKIKTLYIYQWNSLSKENMDFILDWCETNGVVLNAFKVDKSLNKGV